MRTLLESTVLGICVATGVACGNTDTADSAGGRGGTADSPQAGGGMTSGSGGAPAGEGGAGGSTETEVTCASFVSLLSACNVITGTRLAGCQDDNQVLPCAAACIESAGCAEVQADYCFGAYNDFALCLDECQANLKPREFVCGDDEPIPASWRCDGLADCENGDDEACPAGEFGCDDGLRVPAGWECDGVLDCRGGEDEGDCGPSVSCGDGTSVPSSRECDGFADCASEQDEMDCVWLKCPRAP